MDVDTPRFQGALADGHGAMEQTVPAEIVVDPDNGPIPRLPRVFTDLKKTEPELCKEFCRAAGFVLTDGPRFEGTLFPVMARKQISDMVAVNDNSETMMKVFQHGAMKQCREICVFIQGKGNGILIPDSSNNQTIPVHPSKRGSGISALKFVSGEPIEVSKSFHCQSIGGTDLRKYYVAEIELFMIRCVIPYTRPGNSSNFPTFAGSCLYAVHTSFLGTGMTVRKPFPSSFDSFTPDMSLETGRRYSTRTGNLQKAPQKRAGMCMRSVLSHMSSLMT